MESKNIQMKNPMEIRMSPLKDSWYSYHEMTEGHNTENTNYWDAPSTIYKAWIRVASAPTHTHIQLHAHTCTFARLNIDHIVAKSTLYCRHGNARCTTERASKRG